jgi:hypothetical protein
MPERTITFILNTYKAAVRVMGIPLKTGVNSGAPEGPADPAPLVVPVVLM